MTLQGPWEVPGWSLGVPGGPLVVPGILRASQEAPKAPHGRPQGAPCRDLMVKPERFQQFLGARKNGMDQQGEQQAAYHTGGAGFP